MESVRYFVFRRDDQWMVSLDGRDLGRHDTREEALAKAIVMADLMVSMHHDADVMIEEDAGLKLAWRPALTPALPAIPAHAA